MLQNERHSQLHSPLKIPLPMGLLQLFPLVKCKVHSEFSDFDVFHRASNFIDRPQPFSAGSEKEIHVLLIISSENPAVLTETKFSNSTVAFFSVSTLVKQNSVIPKLPGPLTLFAA